MKNTITLSSIGKTWILDLDGTVVLHNGYLINGEDTFLSGAKKFLKSIPEEDMIIFVTSRQDKFAAITECFLKNNGIRYHAIIYNAPFGERILLNDKKPSGLKTAIAVNTDRDKFCDISFKIDKEL